MQTASSPAAEIWYAPTLARARRVRYPRCMSRPTLATLAGIAFILAYVAAVVEVPELVGRMYWAVEALYWCVAGILWVVPVRWLMLWSVHKR